MQTGRLLNTGAAGVFLRDNTSRNQVNFVKVKDFDLTFKIVIIIFTTPPFTTTSTAEEDAGRTRLNTPVALSIRKQCERRKKKVYLSRQL